MAKLKAFCDANSQYKVKGDAVQLFDGSFVGDLTKFDQNGMEQHLKDLKDMDEISL